jgi:hypothetical protein
VGYALESAAPSAFDESGAPVAYRWSLEAPSRELATTFAVGRIDPLSR